ncbi:thiolase C-terminal domain-containing protein [Rhodoligotrophos defluvii]|uniref:thiolase C-terminal domain-containing protein n=1 Tax=Rhodoligotrophos defluvii TaxID=2561934 RepID=UPI0010C95B10|nr:thiolase [Rhodoligotrophos defluvii]
MKTRPVAIVGAAETTQLGRIPNMSNLMLHADAALNAMTDACLQASDIDGVASGYELPTDVAQYLGVRPQWVDGTSVGGCSWVILLRHAAAAIHAGLCSTVLITHGESGRSRVGGPHYEFYPPGSLAEQFEWAYGASGPASLLGIPVLRYMREHGVTMEHLANVAVVQRQWAGLHPRAGQRQPITVSDVLASPPVAWPLHKLMCCLVSDGGGALIVCSTERVDDFPTKPVFLLGSGEATETRLTGIAEISDLMRLEAPRRSARLAFAEAGIKHEDVDHLMIYDAFAHHPIWGLEALGFAGDGGEAAEFIAEGHTGIGGRLPMNTNGGGLSYAHSGSYGMFLLQESIRQLRGTSPAQVPGVRVSVCHGWGGVQAASATAVLSNELPS